MTQPDIEPRSPGPLVNPLPTFQKMHEYFYADFSFPVVYTHYLGVGAECACHCY